MILHVDLFVRSIDKVMPFYTDGLGMKVICDEIVRNDAATYVSDGFTNTYRIVLLKDSAYGTMIELIEFSRHERLSADNIYRTTFSFLTYDLERKIGDLKQKKIYPKSEIFMVDIMELGTSKIIFYEDPEANRVEFIEIERKDVV